MTIEAVQTIGGQVVGIIALALCVAAFADKRDDRLLFILIFANVAFATQFLLLGGWVAGSITALIVLRILLVRRYKRSLPVMGLMLLATLLAAFLTWQNRLDLVPLAAGLVGTYAMFMLQGIAMRILLAVAGALWLAANLLTGSAGAAIAEALIVATNLVTIYRLVRDRASASPTPTFR